MRIEDVNMENRICSLVGIKYPIFQGAMAWISDASLSSAVSNAGGLGIIAGGNAPGTWLRSEIRKVKTLTDKPFGVNIMLLSEYADEIVDIVCEEKVAVVTTGAGNPAKYMEKLKVANIKVIPVIPSVAIAKKMEKIGADALIAEGMEAGGHIGKITTMTLVPQIADAIKIPLIGAGGVGDGRGVAALFMLGADGAQLGTRFLTAYECTAHDNYKKAVINSKDIDSMITGNFTGHPVRVIRNRLAREMAELDKTCFVNLEESIKQFEKMGSGALRKAVVEGDVINGSVMAGQIAGLLKKEQSCKEIIDEIVMEYEALIKGACGKYSL
jgi:enoyl-[acyl-carrier protein] reductase II